MKILRQLTGKVLVGEMGGTTTSSEKSFGCYLPFWKGSRQIDLEIFKGQYK